MDTVSSSQPLLLSKLLQLSIYLSMLTLLSRSMFFSLSTSLSILSQYCFHYNKDKHLSLLLLCSKAASFWFPAFHSCRRNCEKGQAWDGYHGSRNPLYSFFDNFRAVRCPCRAQYCDLTKIDKPSSGCRRWNSWIFRLGSDQFQVGTTNAWHEASQYWR